MKSLNNLLVSFVALMALTACGKFQAVQPPNALLEAASEVCAEGDEACLAQLNNQTQNEPCPVGQVCQKECYLYHSSLGLRDPKLLCTISVGYSGVGADHDVLFTVNGGEQRCFRDHARGVFSTNYGFTVALPAGPVHFVAYEVGERESGGCKQPNSQSRILAEAMIDISSPVLFFEVLSDRSFRSGNLVRLDFDYVFNLGDDADEAAKAIVRCGSETQEVLLLDLPKDLTFGQSCESSASYFVRNRTSTFYSVFPRFYTDTISIPCQNGASTCGAEVTTTTTTLPTPIQNPIANLEVLGGMPIQRQPAPANHLGVVTTLRATIENRGSNSLLLQLQNQNPQPGQPLWINVHCLPQDSFEIPIPWLTQGMVLRAGASLDCNSIVLSSANSINVMLAAENPSTTTTTSTTTSTTMPSQQGPGSFSVTLSQVFAPGVASGSNSANITGYISAQVENQSGEIVNFSTVVVATDAQGQQFESGCINSSGPNRSIQNVGFQIPNVRLGTYEILAFSYFGFGCSGEQVSVGDINPIFNFEIRCAIGSPNSSGVCGSSPSTTTTTSTTTSTTQPAPIAQPVLSVLNSNVLIQDGASTGTANFEVYVHDVTKSYRVLATGPGFTGQPITACFEDINATTANPNLPDLVFSANWIQAYRYTFDLVECTSTAPIKTAFAEGRCTPNYAWDPNQARCVLAQVAGSLSVGNNQPLARQEAPRDHLAVPTTLTAQVRLDSRMGKAIVVQVRGEDGVYQPVACEFSNTVIVPQVPWLTDGMRLRMVAVESCSSTATSSDVVDTVIVELAD